MPPFTRAGLVVHAFVQFSAATPPVLTDNQGVVSVVRNGAGDWTVTLAEEIDPTHRYVILTTVQAAAAQHQIGAAAQTDVAFQVLGFDLAVPGAVDAACRVLVLRVSTPT